MPGAFCAPIASHALEKSIRVSTPQVHRIDPAFPARMVLTVSFVVSPETGFVASVAGHDAQASSACLIPASGYQDATTSPSASQPFVVRPAIRVHRIPPNVRDDGQRPSFGRDGRSCTSDLPVGLSEIFFREGLDNPNQFEAAQQIGVLAHAISIALRSACEAWRRKSMICLPGRKSDRM